MHPFSINVSPNVSFTSQKNQQPSNQTNYPIKMKLSFAFLAAAAAVFVSAAPTADVTDSNDIVFPTEAVLGKFELAKDEIPIYVGEGDESYIVLLNSTIVDLAFADVSSSSSNAKREAEAWGWVRYRVGQIQAKREAEADPWGWVKYRVGQIQAKRDADASPWGWVKYRVGQIQAKRDANADADAWGWVTYRPGQIQS